MKSQLPIVKNNFTAVFGALFAENTQESYQKVVHDYFKTIEATCIQYQIRYVPVSVGENFEKILLTYLVEKQKFG